MSVDYDDLTTIEQAKAWESIGEPMPVDLLTKLAAQIAQPARPEIPWCHVANLAALDAYFPDKDLWFWLPRINQPRMPWLTPRRPQLSPPVARMAVDGTTIPTLKPKEDR